MTARPETLLDTAEKLARKAESQIGPEQAASLYDSMRLLIAYRTGQHRIDYQKIFLENGLPVKAPCTCCPPKK